MANNKRSAKSQSSIQKTRIQLLWSAERELHRQPEEEPIWKFKCWNDYQNVCVENRWKYIFVKQTQQAC